MGYRFPQRIRKRDNPEGKLVLSCLHYLRARGYEAYKVKTQGSPKVGGGFIFDPYRLTGMPDIFAFKRSSNWYDVMYGFECKTQTGRQTDNQEVFEKLFHFPPSRIYAVIRSIADIEAILK